MNWTVRKVVKLTAEMVAEADEVCPHAKVGDNVLMTGEEDSFGPVTRFYECSECSLKAKTQEEELPEFCTDCGKEFKAKELETWVPYDFYAPQGDEPHRLCVTCRTAPKHQARVARDARDEQAEFGE